jgi:hypothetical protein
MFDFDFECGTIPYAESKLQLYHKQRIQMTLLISPNHESAGSLSCGRQHSGQKQFFPSPQHLQAIFSVATLAENNLARVRESVRTIAKTEMQTSLKSFKNQTMDGS